MFVCPICNKSVKDLTAHKARMHPEDGGSSGSADDSANASQENENLEIDGAEPEESGEQGYHCVDCGKPVEKGESRCSSCGCELDWSGL